MMSEPCLEHLLTCRLNPVKARMLDCPAGKGVPESVVPTDRLIWLTRGSLDYRIEQTHHTLAAGAMWLVPAWTRRSWHALAPAGCAVGWVEFIPLPGRVALPGVHVQRPAASMRRQREAFLHHHEATQRASLDEAGSPHALLAEMALKSWLMQVVHQGRPYATSPHHEAGQQARPRAALGDLDDMIERQLADPQLLATLPKLACLSPARLRARFRAAVGMSPGQYLESLRMRQARFLLMTTDLGVKQVAGQVGYDDPLYFSRRYRKYWHHPPTHDRASSP